jgi:energy-coupling factor transporter ATP-binding protein EcfA2
VPVFRTASEEETIALGERLAHTLPPGATVLLIGNLGAGKTTLTKGIVQGLGAAPADEVSSPTFTLIHEYGAPPAVYHVDLYRLESAAMAGCHGSGAHGRQVIVLGVDAMDPAFLERHWNDLPNVGRLRGQGGFRHLATTMPPQSPVAWSTFITGLDPVEHGIFDFVHRDPVTMQPFSSLGRTVEPRFKIPLGAYVLPLSSAHVETLRKGRAFWRILGDRHIPATIMHMPNNFPPERTGEAIAGMGVPDLRGTEGTFTFYTDDPDEAARDVPGGRIVQVHAANGRYVLPVEGPPNTLRRDRRLATEDLIVEADPEGDVARLTIGGAAAIVQRGNGRNGCARISRCWAGWRARGECSAST